MLILGIETATLQTSVALADEHGVVASRSTVRERGHVEFLMPSILEVCAHAGVPLGTLTGIAVGLGPGLFTGMRVGVATAKTMAQILQVPIVGISSLDLLAFAVRHSARTICACIDARRGEVFAAFYRPVEGGVARDGDYAARAPDALVAEAVARDEGMLLVGAALNGEALARVERAGLAPPIARYPTAESLAEMAIPRFARGETAPAARIEPLYVRRPSAEIAWAERGVTIERPLRVKVPKRAVEDREGP